METFPLASCKIVRQAREVLHHWSLQKISCLLGISDLVPNLANAANPPVPFLLSPKGETTDQFTTCTCLRWGLQRWQLSWTSYLLISARALPSCNTIIVLPRVAVTLCLQLGERGEGGTGSQSSLGQGGTWCVCDPSPIQENSCDIWVINMLPVLRHENPNPNPFSQGRVPSCGLFISTGHFS